MKFKFVKRAITIGWSTINTLSGAVFSVLLSVEVIRLCSKDLWGSMVEILLWFGLASHILNFGNQGLLLREFSLMPKKIPENWRDSLQSRTWLYLLVCIILFFLHLNIQLTLLLLTFLSANFVYRSYDVVILYKRQFMVSVLLETAGFLLIASYILVYRENISLNRLVAAFTAAEISKTVIIFFLFSKEFKIPSLKFDAAYFLLTLPFFLFEFTGLLQSKTDLICVTYFLSKDKIAQYQVYSNFLLIAQSAAGFILIPFAKNIYRMRSRSIRKLSLKLLGLGMAIAFLSTFFIELFINWFYHFNMLPLTLIAGAFFIIPIFYYTTVIYQLLKLKRQNLVVLLNIAGIIISLVLNIILIPQSTDGISGAIMAIAITQWIVLFIYIVIQKRLTSHILDTE